MAFPLDLLHDLIHPPLLFLSKVELLEEGDKLFAWDAHRAARELAAESGKFCTLNAVR